MATIVNTTPGSDPSGNSLGAILGLLALAVLAYLFFVYGIPAIRGGSGSTGALPTSPPQEVDLNITQEPQPTGSGNLEQNINIQGGQVGPSTSQTSPAVSPAPSVKSSGTLSPIPSL